ncbi:MAG: fluoride efflux transporter CrcB [candidate division Zixibacteria bacterium]|nr:fluoride efflux transporter CrcB [candidate division Zixibacteria bacterium]
MLQKLLWLAIAGALGTLARYGLGEFVHRFTDTSFPWGTLAVNAVGCFVVGTLGAIFESRGVVSAEVRTLVLVGFMGAFTTFSAFTFETGELIRTANYMHATGNILLQNGLGLSMLFAGLSVGRMV